MTAMNCQTCEERLAAHALGDPLPPGADPAALRQHLDACPACRRKLADLRAALALLHESEKAAASPCRGSPALTPDRRAALRRLAAAPRRRGYLRPSFVALPIAAALALAAWAGFSLLAPSSSEPRPEVALAPMPHAPEKLQPLADLQTPVLQSAPTPAPEIPEPQAAPAAKMRAFAAAEKHRESDRAIPAPSASAAPPAPPVPAAPPAATSRAALRDQPLRRTAIAAPAEQNNPAAAPAPAALDLPLSLAAVSPAPVTVQQFIDAFDPADPAAPTPAAAAEPLTLTAEAAPDPFAPTGSGRLLLKLTVRSAAALPPGARDAHLRLELQPEAIRSHRVLGHTRAQAPAAAPAPIQPAAHTAILVELDPAAPAADPSALIGFAWLRWTADDGIHQTMRPLRRSIIQPAASPDLTITAAAARFAALRQIGPIPADEAAKLREKLQPLQNNPHAHRLLQLLLPNP